MMLVHKDGVIDTIGGGKVEYQAILDAKECKEEVFFYILRKYPLVIVQTLRRMYNNYWG